MKNLFEDLPDNELVLLFEQYQAWNAIGVITDNELGNMRDKYLEELGFSWQTVFTIDLLSTIAKRWCAETRKD